MGAGGWREDPRFQKECRCENHTVPHWLYVDGLWRNQVREAIARMQERYEAFKANPTWLNHQHFLTAVSAVGHEDLPRIQEKRRMMERLKVDVIPPELVALVEVETRPTPAPPAPAALVDEATLRGQLRSTALALEMASSQGEKARLHAELVALDVQMRHLRDGCGGESR